MSARGSKTEPDDNGQSPEPEVPSASSGPGGASAHEFTDWREQLRERVQEIRARKLADRRHDEEAAPTLDFEEQAIAARAEKLRVARSAAEDAGLHDDSGATAARIERLVEEVTEEVADDMAGYRRDDSIIIDPTAETPSPPAALQDSQLGNIDRTGRRSEIADVVDSFLGSVEPESEDSLGAAAIDEIDGLGIVIEADTATEAARTPPAPETEERDLMEAEEWESVVESWHETGAEEEAAQPRDEPTPRLPEQAPQPQETTSRISMSDATEVEATAEDADLLASAPAWARVSYMPGKDTPVPSWATPLDADRGETEPDAVAADDEAEEPAAVPVWAIPAVDRAEPVPSDLFAEHEDGDAIGTVPTDWPVTSTTKPAGASEEVMSAAATPLDESAREDPELHDGPTPSDADFFAPEDGLDEVELFVADGELSPIVDLLESAGQQGIMIDRPEPEPIAAQPVPEPEPEPVPVQPAPILEEAVEFHRPAPQLEPEPQADPEPLAWEAPEPVDAPAPPAAPPADADVYLVGEFRSRGSSAEPDRPALEVDVPAAEVAEVPSDPMFAEPLDDAPEPNPFPVRGGLFDEPDPVVAEPDAELDWDLDANEDPDTILDAQHGSVDPSAPVADRVFSAIADAMVLMTIALLLAIAGASAAGVPVVPFIQAAPLPFLAACLVFAFAYGIFFTGTCGQTLGKMAMRVRVIGADTFRVGYPKAASRAVYYAVAALPAGLGLLPALRDPERRAFHDRMSGTRVVKA